MIEIDSLSRGWNGFSLEDISLTVEDGSYFIVLGPSGAGKSLLLETIAGFYWPDSGRIIMNGREITRIPPEKRGIAMVYQDYMLFPHLSVRENIAYGLRRAGKGEEEVKTQVRWAASLLNIEDILNRNPLKISGGEQQRVALARAIVLRPDLLLLDEPLSSLDATLQKRMRGELLHLHREIGSTVIHVTHSRDEAVSMADRIAVMFEGRIEQVGTPKEVFRSPACRRVADFVGVENLLEGRLDEESTAVVDTGKIRISVVPPEHVSLGDMVLVSIRPEEIMLSPSPLISTARNSIPGRIISMKDMASFVELLVDAGEIFTVHITPQAMEELSLLPGKNVYLSFKATSVNVMGK